MRPSTVRAPRTDTCWPTIARTASSKPSKVPGTRNPGCFAASGPGINKHARLDHLLATLDVAIAREGGKVDALMLSGGEPTVHPAILELIQAATERNVTRVVLNTNGIRIARDDRIRRDVGDHLRRGRRFVAEVIVVATRADYD